MTFTDIAALIALILAAYAATVATGVLVWLMYTSRRRDRALSSIQSPMLSRTEIPATSSPSIQTSAPTQPSAIAETATVLAPSAHDLLPESGLGKPIILIVDDEIDILLIMHRTVRDMLPKYEVKPVTNGVEALAHMALHPVPLAIVDYNMPNMNGLQLTSAIKETYADTCVVLVTAYATPELEQRAKAVGVDHFLPKPFPFDRLEAIIRSVVP
jgi:two-component system, response regulator, stage 0 sporulation protein F